MMAGQPGDPVRTRTVKAFYQLQTRGRPVRGMWSRRDRGLGHQTQDYNAALTALEQLRDDEPAWEHRLVQIYRVTETTHTVLTV